VGTILKTGWHLTVLNRQLFEGIKGHKDCGKLVLDSIILELGRLRRQKDYVKIDFKETENGGIGFN
jgi:hypothetical protein